jgi:Leucine-rich repeat (LRR) protein
VLWLAFKQIVMQLKSPSSPEADESFFTNRSRAALAVILITLSVPLCTGCSRHHNATEIAQIQKLGGEVAIDPADNSVAKVWLMKPEVVDADLQCLTRLPRLREAYLNGAQITDSGIKPLVGLALLVRLDLFDTRVGDAGLASIAHLKGLRRLGLGNTKITDEGLPALSAIPDLRELHVGGTLVTDAGMSHVAQLTRLHELDLSNTEVTSEGIERLQSLKALEVLRLRHTVVDDKAVKTISAFIHLRELDLWETDVSEGKVVALREALPRASVGWAPRNTSARR